MVATYCHLEGENDKTFVFHLNNSSSFEVTASLYQAPHLKAPNLNKRRGGNTIILFNLLLPDNVAIKLFAILTNESREFLEQVHTLTKLVGTFDTLDHRMNLLFKMLGGIVPFNI